jgi:thiamine-phosphate pyrophosphorylase
MNKAGLYAITPDGWPAKRLLAAVDQAIAGGIAMLQYRAKPAPSPDLAKALLTLCQSSGTALIINDDVELARAIGADGVHLGRDDTDLARARERLGNQAIIGVSCYNSLERAAERAAAGADYLAFGSVFASPTKPDAVHCPLEYLTQAGRFGKPVVAIGGVTAENAHQAVAAGADLVAVISDLFEATDIRARARQYQAIFANAGITNNEP